MVTFPYPYMNGRLHLGHAFSLTKAIFRAQYERNKGKNVLFPFAFHCTGMPIQAAANKLKAEIKQFGCPPKFPEQDPEVLAAMMAEAEEAAKKKTAKKTDKSKGSKSKLGEGRGSVATMAISTIYIKKIYFTSSPCATKIKNPIKHRLHAPRLQLKHSHPLLSQTRPSVAKGYTGIVRQWNILTKMVPVSEIPKFVDPEVWLQYFPPHGLSDLKRFGTGVDWRRSFITTATNPFYDSFIRWQFNVLREKGKVLFGKRNNIWSVLDNQVCADHDRSEGEGVGENFGRSVGGAKRRSCTTYRNY